MSTPPEAAQLMPDFPDNADSENRPEINQMEPETAGFFKSLLTRMRIRPAGQGIQYAGLFILILVILFAGIPPALVVADRWFEVLERDVLNPIWCESIYLCGSMLPSYFVVVFISIALLLIVLFFQRNRFVVVEELPLVLIEQNPVVNKQAKIGLFYIYAACIGFAYILIKCLVQHQLPGWSLVYIWLAFMLGCCLRVVPLDSIMSLWKRDRDQWIAMLLTHGSIVAFLASLYSEPSLLWTMTVLLVLALANFWRFRKQVPLIFWIVSLALVVFTIDINGWWTAAVGDEYDFQMLASSMAKLNYQDFGSVLFKADGAHGTHPFFSSALQVISMKFFGTENFGWRFSNPYICALSVGLFYLFCKSFASKRLSLTAAFLLAVSSCLMSFSKIGYNNLQALFALALILAVTTWTLRYKNLFSFACLGSVLAFCFYIYPAGLYLVPLPFLLLLLFDFPPTWEKVRLWLIMMLVFAAIIFPLMLQPVYWETKVPGTFMNQPELVGSTGTFMEHILSNVLYASFTFLFIPNESHFIAASYLDPITSGLFILGFSLLLFQMRRQRFPLFIFLTYIYFIFIIGASHDRTHPPNTRMFLFIPLYALIAAWGVFWIKEKIIHVFSLKNGIPVIATAVFAVLMTALNLYQGYPLSHFRYSHNQSFESLFIRVSERVSAADPNVTKTYAVIVNEEWGVDGLLTMQKVYPSLAYAKIEQIRLTEPVLPDSTFPLLADKNTIVVFFAGMDKHWVKPLDTQLRNLNKVRCEITTTTGDKRFTLYRSPDQPQACYP